MQQRKLGRTGAAVSEIGFGAWAIGGSWGEVSEEDAKGALHAALDNGVTFIDTADVYGDGRSEQIIADVLAERGAKRALRAVTDPRRDFPDLQPGTVDDAAREMHAQECQVRGRSLSDKFDEARRERRA